MPRPFTVPQDDRGRFIARPALERFAEKCRFDATTGCVVWIGGKSSGQFKRLAYGVFRDDGRRWFAHRWAAKNVHGLEIDGLQVDHCCVDHGAPFNNTLCVQHLQAVTQLQNLELQWGRRLWGWDHWEESEPELAQVDDLPFHLTPVWLRPFVRDDRPGVPF